MSRFVTIEVDRDDPSPEETVLTIRVHGGHVDERESAVDLLYARAEELSLELAPVADPAALQAIIDSAPTTAEANPGSVQLFCVMCGQWKLGHDFAEEQRGAKRPVCEVCEHLTRRSP